MPNQALFIADEVIKFPGPYDRMVTRYLSMANPTTRPIGFKVKTTAPARYYVKPIFGIISPGGNASVSITLQPLIGADGNVTGSDQFNRDKQKFMIQSMYVEEADATAAKVTQMLKEASKDEIMQSKLQCTFEDFHLKTVTSAQAIASTSKDVQQQQSAYQTPGHMGQLTIDEPEGKLFNPAVLLALFVLFVGIIIINLLF